MIMVLVMNDDDFIDFDEKLYALIQGYLNVELNDDQKTFNKFCKFRNKIVDFIHKINEENTDDRNI